jgi:hypothetical protein
MVWLLWNTILYRPFRAPVITSQSKFYIAELWYDTVSCHNDPPVSGNCISEARGSAAHQVNNAVGA